MPPFNSISCYLIPINSVEDDAFIEELMEALETQVMPVWDFQGSLLGRNGSEERVIYRECIPSGQVDIQNVTTAA